MNKLILMWAFGLTALPQMASAWWYDTPVVQKAPATTPQPVAPPPVKEKLCDALTVQCDANSNKNDKKAAKKSGVKTQLAPMHAKGASSYTTDCKPNDSARVDASKFCAPLGFTFV